MASKYFSVYYFWNSSQNTCPENIFQEQQGTDEEFTIHKFICETMPYVYLVNGFKNIICLSGKTNGYFRSLFPLYTPTHTHL